MAKNMAGTGRKPNRAPASAFRTKPVRATARPASPSLRVKPGGATGSMSSSKMPSTGRAASPALNIQPGSRSTGPQTGLVGVRRQTGTRAPASAAMRAANRVGGTNVKKTGK